MMYIKNILLISKYYTLAIDISKVMLYFCVVKHNSEALEGVKRLFSKNALIN